MAEEPYYFPLSITQERLWFMDQMSPGSAVFNLNTALRVKIPFSAAILERALNEIVRRHESLRTTFMVVDNEPVQVVKPGLHLPLPVIDLSGLETEEREHRATLMATAESQRPFDLATGPLLRTTLLRLAPQEHIFLMTMHHIISDGWSLGIFWKELSLIWSAFAAGKRSLVPELTIQYGDFAVWQRERLIQEVDEQLAYWKGQLSDLPVVELPADFPRPPLQTFRGAHYPLHISASLAGDLRALSQKRGVTLFMTLLAGFQTLLHRYTSREDIVTGTYIAGRNRAEIENLIGFFLNTLVLRTDFSGDPSFIELLGRVRKVTLDAYEHQDVPFAKLVQELQPVRDLSRNTLCQVLFQMLNVPTLEHEVCGQKPPLLDIERGTAVFDLTCTFWEVSDGLAGHLEYCTDLFKEATIARFAQHFLTLLENAVRDPMQPVGDIAILTPEEIHNIELQCSKGSTRREDPQSLACLFEKQVARTPAATAFLFEGRELLFDELNRKANRLARHLRAIGARRETVVAIYLPRSLDLAVALLAVLKAEAAFLPLDTSYPPARLRFVLEDSGCQVLITYSAPHAALGKYNGAVVLLDRDATTVSKQIDENPLHATSPADLAYLIYTSGSTGQPKGVAVPHRQILNRLAWMWEKYPFTPGEVCCQKTAWSFVDSIWEFLGPLLKGVPTVIVPDAAMKDPYALTDLLAEHRVSRIWVVPSLLRALLESDDNLDARIPDLSFWVSSGEALDIDLYERFQTLLPGRTLHNLYGTSEVWDATWFDPRPNRGRLTRVPIGRPIDNVEAFILDPHGRPVPTGVPGELSIGGVGLARGYWNRPDWNAEKFVLHPFRNGGERLYKTGDLARFLPDGNIEFLGRKDHQIKVRGFRVEPAEIEIALRQHPAIRQVALVARQDAGRGQCLVAYVVTREEASAVPAELRGFLRQRLPEAMIPSAFVFLEQLPLTPSGKVDRKSLPDLDIAGSRARGSYKPPGSAVERTVAEIWQEVLGVGTVGRHDNFFDLGGHSMLMIQVLTKLRNAFQKSVSITDLFRFPTVQSQASFFSQERGTVGGAKRARRGRRERDTARQSPARVLRASE